jgi:hypothetical protein
MYMQEHNCETGEITQRKLTAVEIKQRKDEYDAQVAADQERAAQRQLILDRLGLTADEVKLLLG